MIMCDNGEVETESEGGSDDMPPLEDISDNDSIEYPLEGKKILLLGMHLMQKSKWMKMNSKERIYFTLDAMLTTRYVV